MIGPMPDMFYLCLRCPMLISEWAWYLALSLCPPPADVGSAVAICDYEEFCWKMPSCWFCDCVGFRYWGCAFTALFFWKTPAEECDCGYSGEGMALAWPGRELWALSLPKRSGCFG